MGEPVARETRHDHAVVGTGGGPLAQSVERRVGAKTAKALGKLGIRTVGDLLRHYPRRYADRGRLSELRDLRLGEHVTVIAEVARSDIRPMRNRRGAILTVQITDGTEVVTLTFFGKHRGSLEFHARKLRPGLTGMFTGDVSNYRGSRQLLHPDYETFEDLDAEFAAVDRAERPIPIYPAGQSIPTWKIRTSVAAVLDTLDADDVPEPLPEHYRREHGLPDAFTALHQIHAPRTDGEWKQAMKRFRHEEAFVLQAALAQRRAAALAEPAVARPARSGGIREAFDARLPFDLTAGQRDVGAVLEEELGEPVPMMRLLQGEVGSGKTVVALRAMLQVVDAGGQAALLAPTEVLAQQHLRTVMALMGPLAEAGMLGGAAEGTRVVLLTGSMGVSARRKALAAAASGEAGIVIGTHALLSEVVQIPDLGLVVVDEQHRFGVEQRDALRAKADVTPHLLVMTATPIPRTVAMTSFGDLETSTLRELPRGRAGVTTTTVVPADKLRWVERTWERLRQEIDDGGRAYVVCPRITSTGTVVSGEDPDGEDVAELAVEMVGGAEQVVADVQTPKQDRPTMSAVEDVLPMLRALPALQGVAVGQMHGRLSPEEKDVAMADFSSGRTPVIVSTTVIEVGVDVPDATMMVILDADRFGLSQLHQLRGRVGRGTRPAICLAVTTAAPGSTTFERLSAFAGTNDGFELAETDLRLRREGDILGASQSGRSSSLRLLRVLTDAAIIEAARTAARDLVARDPGLTGEAGLARMVADSLDEEAAAYLERT
ncbi:ATP-dependent DNA helicase RecG [Georgenia halophila]|uniref:Probable DNA 3'-5' helicase RecG n=1 Tax=Georgenia halophila TaxID=620889 RepID=A0ABP8LKA7_9MICO